MRDESSSSLRDEDATSYWSNDQVAEWAKNAGTAQFVAWPAERDERHVEPHQPDRQVLGSQPVTSSVYRSTNDRVVNIIWETS